MVSSPPLLIIGEHRAHFLDLPKDNHIRRGVPTQWITATRRDRRPACPLVDRGRGMAYPIFGAGVVRSFPWRKSQRTRRSAPLIMLGVARYSIVKKKTSSHIPPEKRGQMEMLIRDFFSNIFSWPRSHTIRNCGRRFCPRPLPEQSHGSSCQE